MDYEAEICCCGLYQNLLKEIDYSLDLKSHIVTLTGQPRRQTNIWKSERRKISTNTKSIYIRRQSSEGHYCMGGWRNVIDEVIGNEKDQTITVLNLEIENE